MHAQHAPGAQESTWDLPCTRQESVAAYQGQCFDKLAFPRV